MMTTDQAPLYHPCTSILIEGLKSRGHHDVLAQWDAARAIVDRGTGTMPTTAEGVELPTGFHPSVDPFTPQIKEDPR